MQQLIKKYYQQIRELDKTLKMIEEYWRQYLNNQNVHNIMNIQVRIVPNMFILLELDLTDEYLTEKTITHICTDCECDLYYYSVKYAMQHSGELGDSRDWYHYEFKVYELPAMDVMNWLQEK